MRDTSREISTGFSPNLVADFLARVLGRKRSGRRVLFYFPHNLAEPRTGCHMRAYSLISCLRELGCDLFFFSSTIFTDVPWDKHSVEKMSRDLGIEVYVHKRTKADEKHLAMHTLGEDWLRYTPPDMVKALKRVARSYQPDFLMVTYAMWGALEDALRFVPRKIMDMQDLVTLNGVKQRAVWSGIGPVPVDPFQVDESALDHDMFFHANFQADEKEYRIYDDFDTTIAIAPKEGQLVAEHSLLTSVVYIPMIYAVNDAIVNSYCGLPVFVIGVNVFNYQGYAFWARKIVPYLLQSKPDFCLEVYGDGCNYLIEAPGTHLNGFAPDISAVYEKAPFAVCPLLAGTGQQVKVIEAMAHGVPVVVMKGVSESSPVVHGENGFVAATAKEFADYCQQLDEDRELCRRMGAAAKQKIASEYSVKRMRDSLAKILA